jgi:sigma-B regulation protein RsbU (phosphoserine phosphatase)
MKKDKYEILIADDSEITLKIITEILDIVGHKHELIYAQDGVIACEKALKIIPDLIIMDVLMPERNGIDAVKYIRSHASTADIPIIVLSATESLESAYIAGANDFISKPFHRYELLIKVRSALNLVQKIDEIRHQNYELEIKHQELLAQHHEIAQQRKEMLDDILYSKRIQKAIFPADELANELFPDHFILNMPRNIVSGDFYWISKINNLRILAVVDCTGHGISGAFMTLAGTAFLNEILNRKTIVNAAEILFELRVLVMNLLKQTGEEGEAADGMDITLIMIDEDNKQLQFAGANNPLYLVSKGELFIYKGDRMPIGIHMQFDKPFTQHKLTIQKGDMVYLFSDGYADQFGGPKNKKFRYNQFQELLLEIHKNAPDKQKEILSRTIVDWMGNNEQIDDILIFGFRV